MEDKLDALLMIDIETRHCVCLFVDKFLNPIFFDIYHVIEVLRSIDQDILKRPSNEFIARKLFAGLHEIMEIQLWLVHVDII